jgi:carotenoid cleavage dioxygenase-like enzyme
MVSTETLALALGLGIPAALLVLAILLLIVFKRQILDWLDFKILYNEPTKEGHGFLRSNFAPCREEQTRENLPVKGKLPEGLEGVFLRNGPNPYYDPLGRYHWFDGDGMVHAIRLKDKKASYANRWIETSRLRQELSYLRPVFVKIGELVGAKGLLHLVSQNLKKRLGILDLSQGTGQANTNLVYHGKKLLALHEGDLPYVLKVLCNGVIETIKRASVENDAVGPEGFKQFTAHPKIDRETGDMHFFSYNLRQAPYLTYGVMDETGKLTKQIPVDLPFGPAMMHDMAITSKYVIFLYMPLFFRPKEMVKGEGFPFVFDASKPSMFALLPKSATSAESIQWFCLPAGMIFHTANAWDDPEEKDLVHMYACSTSDYSPLGELLSSTSTKFPAEAARLSTEVLPGLGPLGSPRSSQTSVKSSYLPGAHGGMSLRIPNHSGGGGSLAHPAATGEAKNKSNGKTDGSEAANVSFAVPSKFLRSQRGFNLSVSDYSSEKELQKIAEGGMEVMWDLEGNNNNNSSSVKSLDMLNMSGTDHQEESAASTLFRFTFNTKTGEAVQRKVVEQRAYGSYMLEFPVINDRYLSRRNRYVYLSTFCDGMKTDGVIKVDLSRGEVGEVVGQLHYGRKRFGGECIFTPKLPAAAGKEEREEDDGWLMTFVYDARAKSSLMVVFDAKTMEQVAEVDCLTRVPYGFHGTFLNEKEMEEMQQDVKQEEE